MNTTNIYFLSQINSYLRKNHWRCRRFVWEIENQISNFRYTAYKFKGTFVASFCNHEANKLESQLKAAMIGKYRE